MAHRRGNSYIRRTYFSEATVSNTQLNSRYKMFIGNIDASITSALLRRHFSYYGSIVECTIVRATPTGPPRSYAFVEYTNARSVRRAVREAPHILNEHSLEPTYCHPRNINRTLYDDSHKIFLGLLPYHTSERELYRVFTEYGEVIEVAISIDRNKSNRGFGFVTFADASMASKMIRQRYIIYRNLQLLMKKVDDRYNRRHDANGEDERSELMHRPMYRGRNHRLRRRDQYDYESDDYYDNYNEVVAGRSTGSVNIATNWSEGHAETASTAWSAQSDSQISHHGSGRAGNSEQLNGKATVTIAERAGAELGAGRELSNGSGASGDGVRQKARIVSREFTNSDANMGRGDQVESLYGSAGASDNLEGKTRQEGQSAQESHSRTHNALNAAGQPLADGWVAQDIVEPNHGEGERNSMPQRSVNRLTEYLSRTLARSSPNPQTPRNGNTRSAPHFTAGGDNTSNSNAGDEFRFNYSIEDDNTSNGNAEYDNSSNIGYGTSSDYRARNGHGNGNSNRGSSNRGVRYERIPKSDTGSFRSSFRGFSNPRERNIRLPETYLSWGMLRMSEPHVIPSEDEVDIILTPRSSEDGYASDLPRPSSIFPEVWMSPHNDSIYSTALSTYDATTQTPGPTVQYDMWSSPIPVMLKNEKGKSLFAKSIRRQIEEWKARQAEEQANREGRAVTADAVVQTNPQSNAFTQTESEMRTRGDFLETDGNDNETGIDSLHGPNWKLSFYSDIFRSAKPVESEPPSSPIDYSSEFKMTKKARSTSEDNILYYGVATYPPYLLEDCADSSVSLEDIVESRVENATTNDLKHSSEWSISNSAEKIQELLQPSRDTAVQEGVGLRIPQTVEPGMEQRGGEHSVGETAERTAEQPDVGAIFEQSAAPLDEEVAEQDDEESMPQSPKQNDEQSDAKPKNRGGRASKRKGRNVFGMRCDDIFNCTFVSPRMDAPLISPNSGPGVVSYASVLRTSFTSTNPPPRSVVATVVETSVNINYAEQFAVPAEQDPPQPTSTGIPLPMTPARARCSNRRGRRGNGSARKNVQDKRS